MATAIYPDLKGKVVLVTGGAGGIGSECCKIFAANGAKVVVAGHSLSSAQKLVSQLPGGPHLAAGVNVEDSRSVDQLADLVMSKCGTPPQAVVHCAAIFRNSGGLLQCSEKDYDDTMNVNVKGTFLINKKFVGLMVDNNLKGSIVNLGSVSADGLATAPEYAASKGGVFGISKAIAKEFAGKHIRCMAIAPGPVGTCMGAGDDVLQQISDWVPMKRIATYTEAAQLCVFLASDQASYITCGVYYIHGGLVF